MKKFSRVLVFRVKVSAEIRDEDKRNGRCFDNVLLVHKKNSKQSSHYGNKNLTVDYVFF